MMSPGWICVGVLVSDRIIYCGSGEERRAGRMLKKTGWAGGKLIVQNNYNKGNPGGGDGKKKNKE
jgi:hypothetical protein